jgi:hypothetical protein
MVHSPVVTKGWGRYYGRQSKECIMDNKTEGTISILAALFVLFSAMLDPRVSVALAAIFLIGLAIYKYAFAAKDRSG